MTRISWGHWFLECRSSDRHEFHVQGSLGFQSSNYTQEFAWFLFHEDIGSWNVAQVTNMSVMFNGASTFNQVITFRIFLIQCFLYKNLNQWNMSNVKNVTNIFNGATSFEKVINSYESVNSLIWGKYSIMEIIECQKFKISLGYLN